jgi:hypothetical protein
LYNQSTGGSQVLTAIYGLRKAEKWNRVLKDGIYLGSIYGLKFGFYTLLAIEGGLQLLSDQYLRDVAQRIKDGTATGQDYLYQDEISRRKKESGGSFGGNSDDKKATFTKLKDKDIRALQELFGEGDPKFIGKLKAGSRSGAGKLDLYKEDETGDIYIKPNGKPELPGEKTEYNISQLKSH